MLWMLTENCLADTDPSVNSSYDNVEGSISTSSRGVIKGGVVAHDGLSRSVIRRGVVGHSCIMLL